MATLSDYKICCHCKQEKPFNAFNVDRQVKDSRARTCKECRSIERKKLRAVNPEKYDAAKKKWRQENKEFYASWAFKKRHGMSKEDVLVIVEKQGGCKICKIQIPLGDGKWHIDHDHSCCYRKSCDNCRRGVLCNFCNSMIGFAREDKQILKNAIDYLNYYKRNDR